MERGGVVVLTWYFVKRVLQTPVRSIMPTRKGTMARAGIMVLAMATVGSYGPGRRSMMVLRSRDEAQGSFGNRELQTTGLAGVTQATREAMEPGK